MQLSFYARGDVLVAVPGQPSRPVGDGAEMVSGPPARYVAREFVPPKGLRRTRQGLQVDEPAKYICSSDPFVCESTGPVGERLIRHMTRKRCRPTAARPQGEYPLWPADKATADFLGIPFVPVEVVDGETVPKSASAPTPSSGGSSSPSKGAKGAGKGAD